LERQTAIGGILRAIAGSPTDVQPVLDAIAESAIRFCAAEDATIWLPEGATLRLAAHSGPVPTPPHLVVPLDGTSMPARAFSDAVVLHTADAQTEADRYPVMARAARRFGYHAMVVAPLLREGVAVGTIALRRFDARPFTDRQIDLLRTFADQAVIAIENVRLFNDTKEALARQQATADILYTISTSPTSDQPVLDAVARNALRFCGAEDVVVLLVDGDALEHRAHAGTMRITDPQSGLVKRIPLVRETVSGRATLESRTIHVPDIQASAEFPIGRDLGERLGEHANLAAPLLRQGQAMGAILLRRTDLHPFGDDEVALAEGFAAQAVIAIENVRLFNETKEALERQTATSELLATMSESAFDLKPVFEMVLEKSLALCKAEYGWIRQFDRDGTSRTVAARRPDQTVDTPVPPPDVRTGAGLLGRTYRERRTVHVADIRSDPTVSDSTAMIRIGARTGLGVPLLRGDEVLGVLVLVRIEVRPFSEREIELVEGFARQGAIAIENVRLFNEIQEKSAELAAASRHKSEFLANMSHELRTPLNAIIGFSDVLEQRLFGELNERQADYTHDIASSGRHLLGLVNEILDLSKVEAGRMELEPSEFDLADTIRGALGFVRERAATHAIALAADVPSDLGTVVADERKVRQVLLNLLSNAVKFTPDGGTIAVRATRTAAAVQVSVQDTGIGIAPADQATVFDEFQQVGKASDRSREGTGLGLTLAKRFIELHGGRVWVESEVGTGTTFTFAIPVGRTAAAPT